MGPVLPDPIRAITSGHPASLVCRKQILKAGYGDGAIHAWHSRGLLVRLAPGWYRDASFHPHPFQHQHLVDGYFRSSAKRPRPFVSGTAALEVYGVLDPVDQPPTLLVPWAWQVNIRTQPFAHHRVRGLSDVMAWTARGLNVAEPARALADVFALEGAPLDRVAHLTYQTMHALRLRPVDLLQRWNQLGDPGSRRLIELASTGVLDVESPAEWAVLDEVFGAFPPAPDAQVQITERHRADFAYVFAALTLEYQSERFHARRIDEDGVRTADVRKRGWDSLYITKSMVKDAQGTAELVHRTRREREMLMLEGRLARPFLPAQRHRRVPLRTLVPLG